MTLQAKWMLGGGVAALVGCSDMEKGSYEDAESTADVGEDDIPVDDTGAGAEPVWWRLDADLDIMAGQLSRDSSQLTIAVLDADGVPLCEEEVRVAATATIASRPEPELLTWWSVELGEGTRACAGTYDLNELPRELQLGVGPIHPELQAVAGLVDFLPSEGIETLNGAYARVDPDVDDVWVYGFAGDDDAWLGSSGPAVVAPLRDGLWTLRGVYSFPLPGSL